MNKGIILGAILMVSLFLVWIILFSVTKQRACPDTLPSNYYSCNIPEDCFFHAKYECINREPINCIIDEDLSAREQARELLECVCVDNKCVTQLKR